MCVCVCVYVCTGSNWTGVTLDEFISCRHNLARDRQTRMLADLRPLGCNHRDLDIWNIFVFIHLVAEIVLHLMTLDVKNSRTKLYSKTLSNNINGIS